MARNSLYLRFFLWLWDADPQRLNLCKLFWGTLFFPLAFARWKLVCRFIPRITFVYLVYAVILAACGIWVNALVWSIGCLLLVTAGYIYYQHKKRSTTKREEKERMLSKITELGSRFAEWVAESMIGAWLGERVDWILENTLGRLFDFIDNISDSAANWRKSGFPTIIGEYFKALKKRVCTVVILK